MARRLPKSVIVVVLFLMTLTFVGPPNAVARLSAQALGEVSSTCPSHTYDASIQSPGFGDASATCPTESAPPVPTSAGLPTSTTGRPHPNFVAAETGEKAVLDATPGGRQYTAHYLNDTGPGRNIPGSVVDETIDHGSIAKDLPDRTVFYDTKNDITVVQSKTTGKIMNVRRGAVP